MHRNYQERHYRQLVKGAGLRVFRVVVQETDLFIQAEQDVQELVRESVLRHRGYLESYIRQNPEFAKTLRPWPSRGPVPAIIAQMIFAAQKCSVGPMAAVAGSIAELVGRDILNHSEQVIVENGGDIFIHTHAAVTIAIFAGDSPLSLRVGLRLDPDDHPAAVCTSSGKIGHSLSLGNADAVCVVSDSCALADAAATSIGNRVAAKNDIPQAIEFGKRIEGLRGLAVIHGEAFGLWGRLNVVPLQTKNG